MTIKVGIMGYGNIGKFAVEAVQAAPDMELVGVIRRKESISQNQQPTDFRVVASVEELGEVDVVLLCIPTKSVPESAKDLLARGINTIDCFDIHGQKLVDLRAELNEQAKQHNAVAIMAAGWDPGTDSLVRTLLELMAPKGVTYTNFGPGMSMGHSVAVKAMPGVENALSMTIPLGTGLHRRLVYVVLEPGAEFAQVEQAIKNDPYFINDETYVYQVLDIESLVDMGHGVTIERKGVAGKTHNQLFNWEMRINNPAVTAQVMVSAARASLKQQPGAYTMLEVPLIDYLSGSREDLIKRLV